MAWTRWLCLAGLAVAGPVPAQPASTPKPELTIALGGDMIGPYTAVGEGRDPAGSPVWSLFRNADAGIANQEGSIFDAATFTSYPAAENGGGYPLAPAAVASDMRARGIGLVSKANNHATDFGIEGLLASMRALDAAGIAHAGSGMNAAAACAATLLPTRGGVVALVSAASTFTPMSVAGEPLRSHGRTWQRPGICAVHTRLVELVSPPRLAQLRRDAGSAALAVSDRPGDLRIGDQIFRAAAVPGHLVEMDPDDEAAVIGAIRAARPKAAAVILAVHAHETSGSQDEMPPGGYEPLLLHRANEAPSANDPGLAAFEAKLFHDAVDAGADVVARTGPHVSLGVELYRGKVIFNGLGSLFFSFHGARSYTGPGGRTIRFPREWFESIVPVVHVRGGRVVRIDVHPVVIESSREAGDGRPLPAPPAVASGILERFRRLSVTNGVRLRVSNGVAAIVPESSLR